MDLKKIAKIRKEFPEYDDIPNRELMPLIEAAKANDIDFKVYMDSLEEDDVPEISTIKIETLLEELNVSILKLIDKEQRDDSKSIVQALSQLNSELVKFNKKEFPTPIVNVPKMDTPIINVEAPIVEVTAPKQEIPKEWTFDIVRDRNGYIQNVIARS